MTAREIDQLNPALADRYRIERELGRGGMATVYLAHDIKHGRDVAIKVLHPDLGAALGGDRFQREINTTAKLQHPHILPLLDSGDADGLLYYVMPLVTGETLRARLEREKQLPIDEAIRIARESADALGYAHGLGIVHRDIKPENILLQNGHALVADFGIALALQSAGSARSTQTGLSLGTPSYMSPEQAMGERIIDARSDVYALGAMTYEMLAGEPPFTGPSAQAIVAKVISGEAAPIATLRKSVPPHVAAAVHVALEKLPADRFATAAEFASALGNHSFTNASTSNRSRDVAATAQRTRLRDPIVVGLGAATLVLAAALAFVTQRPPATVDPFPVRTEISGAVVSNTALTAGVSSTLAPRGSAVMSDDGHSVIYLGPSAVGAGTVLYLRRLDQLTAREISGTTNPASPVFSPDGHWVAFVAGRRKIVKVPLDGEGPVTIADVPDNGGIDWAPRGEIVLGFGVMEGLKGLGRVSADGGGTIRPFTQINSARKELSHEWPRVLADGNNVLFSIWYGAPETSEIGIASLNDGKVTPLGVIGARALGVVGGQLVYVRFDGMAMSVPFDIEHRLVTGTPTQVQDSIRIVDASGGDAGAFLTHAGGLVFSRGALNRRLVWVDRHGVARPGLAEQHEFEFVRIAPSGRQVAVTVSTGAKSDIWLLDVTTGALTPLTSSGTARNPVWSADGKRILFVSTQGGRSAFWWQPADGSGPAVKAADTPHNAWNIDLAPDERTTVFNAIYDGTFNVETFVLDSTHARHDVSASPTAIEALGRFSPDGRLIAYMSDESGRPEIYVRSFPDGGGRIQVSSSGGTRPVWGRDGKTLYFRQGAQGTLLVNRGTGTAMVAATLTRNPGLGVTARQTLFDGPYDREFDVSADGSAFLMIETTGSNMTLVAIPNWVTELRRLTTKSKR
ncbi:MAG: protein kinase [Gemmatimonas sp.]